MRMLEHLNGRTKSICDTPPGLRLCVYDVLVNETISDLLYDLERPKIQPDYYPEGYDTQWWRPPYSSYNRSRYPRFNWGLLKYRLECTYDRKQGNFHLLLEEEITRQFMVIGENDNIRPRGAGWCKESKNGPTGSSVDPNHRSYTRPLCHCGYPCEMKCNPNLREIYYCCVVKSSKWLSNYDIEHELWVKNTLVGCSFRENIAMEEPVIPNSCEIESD